MDVPVRLSVVVAVVVTVEVSLVTTSLTVSIDWPVVVAVREPVNQLPLAVVVRVSAVVEVDVSPYDDAFDDGGGMPPAVVVALQSPVSTSARISVR